MTVITSMLFFIAIVGGLISVTYLLTSMSRVVQKDRQEGIEQAHKCFKLASKPMLTVIIIIEAGALAFLTYLSFFW